MREVAGLRCALHGREDGEPVLLIHGSHVADAFLPLAAEPMLAERYRLIRYHRRGFADGPRHTGPFSIADQARDARALLEALGIPRAHVVGHSYGAVTALQLACDAGDVVHSLVLLEPPLPGAEGGPTPELFAPLVARYQAGDARGAVDAFMTAIGCGDWRSAAERHLPGAPKQAERDAPTFFEVEVPALAGWTFGEREASRITQPVLFGIGSESGVAFDGPRRYFVSHVPHAEVAELHGLDHLLQMRDPAKVAAPIAEFLARHPI